MINHFISGSDEYAVYRPVYPRELVDELVRISPGNRLALDCACGTGQLSVLLAERFEEVVAIDSSPSQIAHAPLCPRVRYRVASADQSGLPPASADLVTVAQAAHWLNLEKFYEEARRVMRSQGVLALITYGILHVDDPEIGRLVQEFYGQISPWWPPERRHVEDGYSSLPFPFSERLLPELEMKATWDLAGLVGYLRTWSAVRAAQTSTGEELVTRFEERLRFAWGTSDVCRLITWPLTVRAGIVEP